MLLIANICCSCLNSSVKTIFCFVLCQHVDRTFHDITGKVTKNDSGIWLIPFDDYALRPLEGLVPMLEKAEVAKCEGPYCGWPYYFAMLCIMR